MQKLDISVYPIGHVFYIARSTSDYSQEFLLAQGHQWCRDVYTLTPKAEKRYISKINMEVNSDGVHIVYWATTGECHRIDTGSKLFGYEKIYSEQEIGMFADINEAFAFAKAKCEAGEKYYGPK